MSAIHRSGSRALKINSFTVITTTVTRALKLVFGRFPIGCASQVSASGIDHEESLGISDDPDAILLLKLGIDPKAEIREVSNSEHSAWFEDCSGKKEPQEHHEAGREEPAHRGPDDGAPHFVDRISGRAFDGLGLSPGRSPYCLGGGFRFLY